MKLKQAKVPMYVYTDTTYFGDPFIDSERGITVSHKNADIMQKLNEFVTSNAENPYVDKTYQTGNPREETENIQTSYKRNVALSHWDEIQEKYGDKIQELINEKSSEQDVSHEKMALSLGWYAYRAEQLGIGQNAINYMMDNITKNTSPSHPDPYVNTQTAHHCIETFKTVPNYERGKEILETLNPDSLVHVLDYITYEGYNQKAINAIGNCKDSSDAYHLNDIVTPTDIHGKPNKQFVPPQQAHAITEACNKLYDYAKQTGYSGTHTYHTASNIADLIIDRTLSTHEDDDNYTTKFVDKFIESLQDYDLERIYHDFDYHRGHISLPEFAKIYKEQQQKAKKAEMQQQQEEEKKPKKDKKNKKKDKKEDKKKDKKEKKKDKKKSKKSKSARLQELDAKFGHIEMPDADDEYTP